MRLPDTTTDMPPANSPEHLLTMWVLIQAGKDFTRALFYERRYTRKYISRFLLEPSPALYFWCERAGADADEVNLRARELCEMESVDKTEVNI